MRQQLKHEPLLPPQKVAGASGSGRPFAIYLRAAIRELEESFIHPGLELGAVLRGSGELYYRGVYFPLGEGDVYFLDPLLAHGHRGLEANGTDLVIVQIQKQALLRASPRDTDLRLYAPFLGVREGTPPVLALKGVARRLEKARRFQEEREPFSDLKAWRLILDSVIRIAEAFAARSGYEDFGPQGADASMHRLLDAVHNGYLTDVTMAGFAHQVGLSSTRASHLFTEKMGLPMVEYRNRLRAALAVSLLLETDEKVLAISAKCGFQSLSQFQRQFKQITGRSPGAFRKPQGAGLLGTHIKGDQLYR